GSDAADRAGRATRRVARLLRAGHVGDGEAAGEAQRIGGGSAGAVLRGLLGPAVLGLELVERRPHGARMVPLAAAVHILSAATPHDAILAGANTGDAGVSTSASRASGRPHPSPVHASSSPNSASVSTVTRTMSPSITTTASRRSPFLTSRP